MCKFQVCLRISEAFNMPAWEVCLYPTEICIFNFSKIKQMVNWLWFFGIRDLAMTKNMNITSAFGKCQRASCLWWQLRMIFLQNISNFYKTFRNSKMSKILLEYQHESSLERFCAHFESKGCFSDQILPAFLRCCQSNYHAIAEILP